MPAKLALRDVWIWVKTHINVHNVLHIIRTFKILQLLVFSENSHDYLRNLISRIPDETEVAHRIMAASSASPANTDSGLDGLGKHVS